MFLKAVDHNPSGSRLPSFYECSRIHPQTADGTWNELRLEGPGDSSVTVELLPGYVYYVLNADGGNVDTIQVREPKATA